MKQTKVWSLFKAMAVMLMLLTAPVVSAQSGGLSLKYRCVFSSLYQNSLLPQFSLSNEGSAAVSLDELKIRYYYSKEGSVPEKSVVRFLSGSASLSRADITIDLQQGYLDVGFTEDAGTLAPGTDVSIGLLVYKEDWSLYDQSNDYSYDKRYKLMAPSLKITLYRNGLLLSGIPEGEPLPSPGPLKVGSVVISQSSYHLTYPEEEVTIGMNVLGDHNVYVDFNTYDTRLNLKAHGPLTPGETAQAPFRINWALIPPGTVETLIIPVEIRGQLPSGSYSREALNYDGVTLTIEKPADVAQHELRLEAESRINMASFNISGTGTAFGDFSFYDVASLYFDEGTALSLEAIAPPRLPCYCDYAVFSHWAGDLPFPVSNTIFDMVVDQDRTITAVYRIEHDYDPSITPTAPGYPSPTPAPTATPIPPLSVPENLVKKGLLITGNLSGGDSAVKERLELLGYQITVLSDALFTSSDALGLDLVLISSTTDPSLLEGKFGEVEAPVICWEQELYEELGLAAPGDSFGITESSSMNLWEDYNDLEPVEGSLYYGKRTITRNPVPLGWVSKETWPFATQIGQIVDSPEKGTIFISPDGAPRAGVFLRDNTALYLTDYGWKIFESLINWASPRLALETVSPREVTVYNDSGPPMLIFENQGLDLEWKHQIDFNSNWLVPSANSGTLESGFTGSMDIQIKWDMFLEGEIKEQPIGLIFFSNPRVPNELKFVHYIIRAVNLPGGVLLGDVDSSGDINILDAVKTAQFAVGLTPLGFNPHAGDVNKDGTVSIADALLIAQFCVGILTEF